MSEFRDILAGEALTREHPGQHQVENSSFVIEPASGNAENGYVADKRYHKHCTRQDRRAIQQFFRARLSNCLPCDVIRIDRHTAGYKEKVCPIAEQIPNFSLDMLSIIRREDNTKDLGADLSHFAAQYRFELVFDKPGINLISSNDDARASLS